MYIANVGFRSNLIKHTIKGLIKSIIFVTYFPSLLNNNNLMLQ